VFLLHFQEQYLLHQIQLLQGKLQVINLILFRQEKKYDNLQLHLRRLFLLHHLLHPLLLNNLLMLEQHMLLL
jgi:hypothetical protein